MLWCCRCMCRSCVFDSDFQPASYVGPHIRYAVTVVILAGFAGAGFITVPIYWFCFICVSYRWNAYYLLFTILRKYLQTPEVIRGYDATNDDWNWELLLWLAVLGVVNGLLVTPES